MYKAIKNKTYIVLATALLALSCTGVSFAQDVWLNIGSVSIGVSAVPVVTSVVPSKGATSVSTSVAIYGSSFTGATSVKIGTHEVSSFTVVSDSRINAVIQPGIRPGVYHVTVTNPSGTSAETDDDRFTVTSEGALTIVIDDYETDDRIYYTDGTSTIDYLVNDQLVYEGLRANKLGYQYTSGWGSVFGGILPIDLDISLATGVVLWVKGDGNANTVRLDLKESGVAPGNGEVYSSPIMYINNTSWRRFQIPYEKFTRNPYDGVSGGNGTFDKNIVQYQLVYTGTNANASGLKHHIDYIAAVQLVPGPVPGTPEITSSIRNGSDVALAWNPSIDPSLVNHYNVYRSTAPDFVPDESNKIATPVNTSYTDQGVGADQADYFYKVSVTDINMSESDRRGNMAYKAYYDLRHNVDISNIFWLSFPYRSQYLRASDIAAVVPNCTKVVRLSPMTQDYENWENFFGNWSGNNFAVTPGESYAVVIGANSAFALTGVYLRSTLIDMRHHQTISNINWISLPYHSVYQTASDISDDLPNATKISRFNSYSQQWENWESFFGNWSGDNFQVEPKRGTAVIINTDTLWSPEVYR